MEINKQTILAYTNFDALSKDVIELAKEIMPDKVIYINFLNDEVQVTMRVSQHNTNVNVVEGTTIPVAAAICNQIDYAKGTPLVSKDIRKNNFDEKVNQTIRDSNIGAYLGIPISYADGMRFGTLCAAHHDEREFDDKDIELLQSVAKLFAYYLELESLAYKDALTGINNFQFLVTRHNEIINSGGLVIMLDLDYFKDVNDLYGHLVGDEVLKEVGRKLKTFADNFNTAYTIRLGGDEFLIFIQDALNDTTIKAELTKLIANFKKWNTRIGDVPLSASFGAMLLKPNTYDNFNALLKHIDLVLYKAKHQGKGTFVFEATN